MTFLHWDLIYKINYQTERNYKKIPLINNINFLRIKGIFSKNFDATQLIMLQV